MIQLLGLLGRRSEKAHVYCSNWVLIGINHVFVWHLMKEIKNLHQPLKPIKLYDCKNKAKRDSYFIYS